MLAVIALAAVAMAPAAGADVPRAPLIANIVERHYVPRVHAFNRSAQELVAGLESLCLAPDGPALARARAGWTEAMLAWESLSAVDFGPLVSRRSDVRVDFPQVRPYLIDRALGVPTTTLKGLESVGAPAKGFAALEFLLWTPPARPALLADRARCAYASLLSQDIADEARGLKAAFEELAAGTLPETSADRAFAGLLNLTMSGLEQLGFHKMERPAEKTAGKTFPRLQSGQTAAAWNAQWISIRRVLFGSADDANDGVDAVLRASGLSTASAHMRGASDRITKAMAGIKATPTQAIAAARAIDALRTILVEEVAAGLNIPLEFGEQSGD